MVIRSLLELEVPGVRSFDDPRLEWRRLFSEFVGTLLLVLVGAGGAVVDAASGGQIGRAAGVAAPGLLVLAVILTRGDAGGRAAARGALARTPADLPVDPSR